MLLKRPLHRDNCRESDEDMEYMKKTLLDDPESLTRAQSIRCKTLSLNSVRPLKMACLLKHLRCVQLLAEAGACLDNNEQEEAFLFDNTPLEYSYVLSQDSEVLTYLLNKGACPNRCFKSVNSPTTILVSALKKKNNAVVKTLLEHGCFTECMEKNEHGHEAISQWVDNPISYTLRNGNLEGFKLLLLHGALKTLVYWQRFQAQTQHYRRPECTLLHSLLPLLHSSNCSIDEVVEGVETYKQFGGDMWVQAIPREIVYESSPSSAPENVYEYTVRTSRFQNMPELQEKVKEVMTQPLSLKSMARLVLFKQLGRNYWRESQMLEIPRELKQFLKFGVTYDLMQQDG